MLELLARQNVHRDTFMWWSYLAMSPRVYEAQLGWVGSYKYVYNSGCPPRVPEKVAKNVTERSHDREESVSRGRQPTHERLIVRRFELNAVAGMSSWMLDSAPLKH
jgi:hypothetical protein